MKNVFGYYYSLALSSVSLIFAVKAKIIRDPLVGWLIVAFLLVVGIGIFLLDRRLRKKKRSKDIKFVYSDHYVPWTPVPEPVYHPVPKPACEAPFVVTFVVFGAEKLEPKSGQPGYAQHMEALRRIRLHFGRPMVVEEDGKLVSVNIEHGAFDALQTVELRIDFNWHAPVLSGLHLPKHLGPIIEEITSGFPCEPWKLCLTKTDDSDYHDHILFENGSFVLQSVHEKHRLAVAESIRHGRDVY